MSKECLDWHWLSYFDWEWMGLIWNFISNDSYKIKLSAMEQLFIAM